MTRTLIASAIPADSLHGDEGQDVYSAFEEAWIVHRADELMAERLNDRDRLCELMSGIDGTEIDFPLHRALMNLDRAIKGERAAQDARDTALSQIQRALRV